MAQWSNLNQNNSFISLPQLPVLCEISGAIHQALVDLIADRKAGWQTKYR